jgi:hypothetical protein
MAVPDEASQADGEKRVGTEASPVRDFGVGAVMGGSFGALGAVATKFPVGPPALRCGAVGGCLASCYLPITVTSQRARAQGGQGIGQLGKGRTALFGANADTLLSAALPGRAAWRR